MKKITLEVWNTKTGNSKIVCLDNKLLIHLIEAIFVITTNLTKAFTRHL